MMFAGWSLTYGVDQAHLPNLFDVQVKVERYLCDSTDSYEVAVAALFFSSL